MNNGIRKAQIGPGNLGTSSGSGSGCDFLVARFRASPLSWANHGMICGFSKFHRQSRWLGPLADAPGRDPSFAQNCPLSDGIVIKCRSWLVRWWDPDTVAVLFVLVSGIRCIRRGQIDSTPPLRRSLPSSDAPAVCLSHHPTLYFSPGLAAPGFITSSWSAIAFRGDVFAHHPPT